MAPKKKPVIHHEEPEKIDVEDLKVRKKKFRGKMMRIARSESPPIESSLNKLPVELKVKILQWVALALRGEKHSGISGALSVNNWLLNLAAKLPDWVIPALTVLYEEPDLDSLDRYVRFHNSMKAFPDSPFITTKFLKLPLDKPFEYISKVFRLALDAHLLKRRVMGRASFDLGALLSQIYRPTLKELIFIDPKDTPILRQAGVQPVKWTYPEEVFFVLDSTQQRLTHWTWNGRWLFPKGGKELLEKQCLWIADIHQLPCLASLENLELFNFHIKGIRSPDVSEAEASDGDGEGLGKKKSHGESELAQALGHLKHLKSVTFKSSNMANKTLFSIISLPLESLTVDNCDHFTSSALRRYLSKNGKGLKELILKHNKALDLSFLLDLCYLCPNLEVLVVDCLYYNTFATSRDSEPNYDSLLEPDQELNWPESLRYLEMRHLRHWSPDAAENFFMSLLKAAPTLVNLRTLILNAKLDIKRDENWRERNKVRNTMKEALQKMFQRPFTPPSTYFNSMEAFAAWRAAQKKANESDSDVPIIKVSYKRKPNSPQVVIGDDNSNDEPIAVDRRKRVAALTTATTSRTTKRMRIIMARDEPETETDNDFTTPAKPRRTRELPVRKTRSNMRKKPPVATRKSTRQIDRQTERETRNRLKPEQKESNDEASKSLGPSGFLRPRKGCATKHIGSISPLRTRSKAITTTSLPPEPKSELDHLLANIKRGKVPVQGLCDVCDILIDNQRPTDLQFTENDFLDTEGEEDDPDFDGGNMRTSDVSDFESEEDGGGLDAGSESEAEFTDGGSEDELF